MALHGNSIATLEGAYYVGDFLSESEANELSTKVPLMTFIIFFKKKTTTHKYE